MTLAQSRHRRPAYIAGMALMFSGLLLVLLVVLADYATTDMAQQRQALLEAQAEQILQSARAWSQLPIAELAESGSRTLPVDQLVPPQTTGAVELVLIRASDSLTLVDCKLRLQRGRATVRRQVRWPLAISESAPQ